MIPIRLREGRLTILMQKLLGMPMAVRVLIGELTAGHKTVLAMESGH